MELSEYNDIDILTACLVGECAREPIGGKAAVAWVVRNRKRDPRWPNTYREVILQPKQFSCFNPGLFKPEIIQKRYEHLWWKECRLIAYGVMADYVCDPTDSANHYHATYIDIPDWAKGETPVTIIGKHIFYKL